MIEEAAIQPELISQQQPMIRNTKFAPLKKPRLAGSSFTRWLKEEQSQTEWIAKCSFHSVYNNESFDEYKEYLASKVYALFGVPIPKTILAEQCIDEEAQRNNLIKDRQGIKKPRIHIISQFVTGFELVGRHFVNDYKTSAKNSKKQLFCNSETKIPLRGLGRVMAVAILIHDYDFIGNSGGNLGYIPKEDGKYFEILKIDPGEALTLQELIAESKTLHNPLNKKGAIVGTLGERINYDDLNEFDQREFVQTLKEVLEVKASKLEEVFLPFFEIDKKFRTVFEELLNRRKDLLYVFTSEVRGLIDSYITKVEEKEAKRLMANWTQPPVSLSTQMQEKAALIRDKAQLEAYTAANNINSANTKADQTSPEGLKFVGRASELSQIKELFSANSGIVGCAIVGSAGFGKSQLASEYVRRNQKEMYSCVLWLHSEQRDLILDQIQIYLETCFNVKINSKDKDDRALTVKTLYEILSNQVKGVKKACIIFDSTEGMSQIADYLPDQQIFPNLKLDILVTSRYKKWDKAFGETIELQAFGPSETKNYIKKCFLSPLTSLEDEQLSKDAERLNSLLGGLPLAISLAVSYIQQKEKGKEMSICEFCNFLTEGNKSKTFLPESKQITEKNQESEQAENESEQAESESEQAESESEQAEDKSEQAEDKSEQAENESEQAENESKSLNYISTILTLALADLRSKNHNIESILDLMAYLSPEGISITLLKDCWKDCRRKYLLRNRSGEEIASQFRKRNEKKDGAGANMINPEGSFFVEPDDFISYINTSLNEDFEGSNSKDFDKALELMFLYSIIAPDSTELIQKQGKENERKSDRDLDVTKIKVHQLTQQVIQLNHRESGVSESCHENVFQWVLNQLYHNERDPKEIRRAGLILPHGKYLKTFQNDMGEQLRAELLQKVAVSQLDGAGEYKSALENLEKALRINEKRFGRCHPKIAFLHDEIGTAWGGLGNYEKKKDSLTSALEIFENVYGKDHLYTVGALHNLGVAWEELGDYEKHKDFASRAFKICEKHYGINHPETSSTMANLANAWGGLGNYEKQKDLLTRALEIKEKYYGKDHPETIAILFSLGNTWGCLGNHEKQKNLLIRALEISEEHYGRAHPQTGIAMASLGKSWGSLGNYEKQKDLLIKALKIIQEHYGKDHPTTCGILEDLAYTWGQLGNYERKKTLLIQILEIYEQRHGNDHPKTVHILKKLAFAWGELGDYEMKRDLFAHLLEIYEQQHGSDHPIICEILEGLSDAWGELGDYERKKDILIRALEICDTYYDEDYNPTTTGIMAKLADAWIYLGNYEEAEDLLCQALELNVFYGQNESVIGSNYMSLGDVYFQMEDFEDALDHYSRAYKIFQKKFGEAHKHTIDAATKLKITKEFT